MKIFISLSLLVAVTLAEPPSYRQQSAQRERATYYFAKQQEAEPAAVAAPYPPSGWRPAGPAFDFPEKQEQRLPAASQQQYGAPAVPQNQYQPSSGSYGAPARVQNQYAAPAAPQNPDNTPQQQYGAPSSTPQQQYGAPSSTPQQQYGAPNPPQQYAPPQPTTVEPPSVTDFEESTFPTATESQAESVNELDETATANDQKQSGEYYVALPDGRLQRVQYISRQDIEAMKYFAKIRAENVEPLRGPIFNYQPLQRLQFAPAQLQVTLEDRPLLPANSEPAQKSQKIQTAAKQEIEPLAAEVGSSFAGYPAKYQAPVAPVAEQRYLISF